VIHDPAKGVLVGTISQIDAEGVIRGGQDAHDGQVFFALLGIEETPEARRGGSPCLCRAERPPAAREPKAGRAKDCGGVKKRRKPARSQ
jgi:hypothetical protein